MRYLTTVLLPAMGSQIGFRDERELRTLAESIDSLVRGKAATSADILVQRFKSIHQQYVKVESQNRQYCKGVFDFDDRLDPISSNKLPAFFAARRKSYFNASFVIEDSLNTFGHSGGFKKIIGICSAMGSILPLERG